LAGIAEAGARRVAAAVLPLWAPVLLTLVTAVCYANGLNLGFHFDDAHVIQDNPHIRSLWSIPRFFVDPSTSSASPANLVLRPLLLTTFALNHAISAERPWSYHLVNLALHALSVALIFRIVRDHLWLGAERVPVAFGAALIVAAHPLNTSAVDYISARSALMTAVLYLAAFDAALRARRGTSLLLFTLALLTKENAVTFPLALMGYWLLSGRAERPEATGRAVFLGALAALAVTGLAYRAVLVPRPVIQATHASDVTSWTYAMTEWSAYLYYLRLFLWPNALVIDRLDYPVVRAFSEPQAWCSLVALGALGFVAWRLRRGAPALTFAAIWFFVTLAAESTVFPLAEPVNEHRPYLAMLGLGAAASVILWRATWSVTRHCRVGTLPAFLAIVCGVTLACGWATRGRNDVWRDDFTLWLDATRKAPENPRAWTNAGHAALKLGQHATARSFLLEGHRLSPCYSYALLNLSALARATGDLEAALRWADEATRCNPGHALSHHYRAVALESVARLEEALGEARAATTLDPRHANAWMQQARLLERQGGWAAAAEAYERALAADPQLTDAAMGAGVIYSHRLADPERAVQRFRTVLAVHAAHYGAHYQLAVALLKTGREAEAAAAWRAFLPLAETAGDRATLEAAPARLKVLGGSATRPIREADRAS
jgi:Tfp pilus assembly protein PilF